MLYSTLLDDLQSETIAHRRYDATSIGFHWATATLVAAMFWSAHAHDGAEDGATAALTLLVHRSMGIALWLLTIARLTWKGMFGAAPPLPKAMTPAQRAAAGAMHAMLYGLLLLMPAAGLAQSLLRGKAFPLFFGEFPAIMARDTAAMGIAHQLHQAGATILLVLIGLHALAGILHGIFRRDGVLGSMLPRLGAKGRESGF